MGLTLQSDIQYLKGVGPKIASSLKRLGLHTVGDCLFCFPREYDDRRALPKISELQTGDVKTIFATIRSVKEKKVKRGVTLIEAVLEDASSKITGIWFNQKFLLPVLQPGAKVIVKGKVESSLFYQTSQIQVQSTELLKSRKDIDESIGVVMPVYALTAGVYQYQVRSIIKESLKVGLPLVKDMLPAYLKQKLSLIPLKQAIEHLHFPKSVEGYKQARYRLVFDEFFFYQCRLEKQRKSHKRINNCDALVRKNTHINAYLNALPYQLTGAQNRVLADIFNDMAQQQSMNRLLQGDVGAGKTEVAFISMLCALENNKNAVLMAPTEILATQHYLKFKNFLETIDVPCLLLKSKMKKSDKEKVLQLIKAQSKVVLIGTHALIQDYVDLSNCGIVIIDEQHRFGVIQRLTLQQKGNSPHCLFMTATPIPRTFMLTTYGDLDKSIIDEMPPGRLPVKTVHAKEEYLPQVYQSCVARLMKGEQLYVVYPLIEESEKIDLRSAMEGFEQLKQLFPDYSVDLLHGKMTTSEKESVMARFKQNESQILVSTTVIEVGVDVPNASMMIIQHADRFGLSQLHQLRGRVGRNGNQAICYLISENKSETAKERIKAMVDTTDGFKIAEVDLKIRGPGDILGTNQSGLPNFNVSDLIRDEKVLLLARKVANNVLREDPNLESSQHASIKEKMNEDQHVFIGEYLN